MANRGFRRSGIKPPQRQIANSGIFGIADIAFGANLQVAVGGTIGGVVAEAAETLVRTRGEVFARVDNSGSADNQIHGAMGMIVVSQDAFDVGITALPTPLADVGNDWFVYVSMAMHANGAGGATDVSIGANARFPFDSRGMRKLKSGEVLAVVFEFAQSDATTGTIMDMSYVMRFQSKL